MTVRDLDVDRVGGTISMVLANESLVGLLAEASSALSSSMFDVARTDRPHTRNLARDWPLLYLVRLEDIQVSRDGSGLEVHLTYSWNYRGFFWRGAGDGCSESRPSHTGGVDCETE